MTDQDNLQEAHDFWRWMDVSSGVELLGQYLERMESILKPHPASEPGQEAYDPFEAEFTEVVLARTLRKSFFLVLYGFLESRLKEECEVRKETRDDVLLSLRDIRGRSTIEQAKIYLRKVLRVKFSFSTAEWSEINNYRRLRNCFIHNDGVLGDAMRAGDLLELRRFVDGKETLRSDGDAIVIAQGFCEEALRTIERFLLSLLEATSA